MKRASRLQTIAISVLFAIWSIDARAVTYFGDQTQVMSDWAVSYDGPTSYSNDPVTLPPVTVEAKGDWVTLCNGPSCTYLWNASEEEARLRFILLGVDPLVAEVFSKKIRPSACKYPNGTDGTRAVTKDSVQELRNNAANVIIRSTFTPMQLIQLHGRPVEVQFGDGSKQVFEFNAYGSTQVPIAPVQGGNGVAQSACTQSL